MKHFFSELTYFTTGFASIIAIDYTHYLDGADKFVKFLVGASMLTYTCIKIFFLLKNNKNNKNEKED